MGQLQLATEIADPEAALLARAYALILSWGCPTCGKPYPCPCDASATEEAVPKVIPNSNSEAELTPKVMATPREVIATENSVVAITDTGNLSAMATTKTTTKKGVLVAAIHQ